MRRGPVALAVSAAVVTLATSAQAQTPTEDSASGTGSTSLSWDFNFAARSGPSGENPTGAGSVTYLDSLTTRGSVNCLNVLGFIAIIGIRGDAGSAYPGVVVTAADGEVVADGQDFFDARPSSGEPNQCLITPAPLFPERVTVGDIVVRNAPAFPTTKEQCKRGGWRNFGTAFKNEGQCVAFVQRRPKPT
jgi:hypothetical protein